VEGIKEEVVLSPAHALSLIAAGEGISLVFLEDVLLLIRWLDCTDSCFMLVVMY
jgi:hypothetical protein